MQVQTEMSTLSYNITEQALPSGKGQIIILELVGPLTKANIVCMESVAEKVSQSQAGWVVIDMRKVDQQFERTMLPKFTQFQKAIRGKPAELRLFGMHPELRGALTLAGVIRAAEVYDTLPQALQSLAWKRS